MNSPYPLLPGPEPSEKSKARSRPEKSEDLALPECRECKQARVRPTGRAWVSGQAPARADLFAPSPGLQIHSHKQLLLFHFRNACVIFSTHYSVVHFFN